MSIFDGMTNLYSISKTLRFELKPIGKTKDLLEQVDFFKKDQEKANAYPEMKQLLDGLHRDFIDTALSNITKLSIDQNPDFKKIRKEITQHFVDSKKLGEKDVINKLLDKYPEQKKQIEQFHGFRGYFLTYKQNRENLYKDEGKAGQIATRLIDENLPRFLKNKEIVEQVIGKLDDFIVIEKNEKQEQQNRLVDNYTDFFDVNNYHHYLTQPSIDAYNKVIGNFNHSINYYKQQHSSVKIPLLQLLYKLPLAPRDTVHWLPQQIENDEQLLQTIESVKNRIDGNILPFLKNILQPVLQVGSLYDLSGIYISIKTLEQWGGIALTGWASFREITHDISKGGDEPKVKKEYKEFPFVSLQQIKDYLDEKQQLGVDSVAIFGEEKAKNIISKGFSDFFFESIQHHVTTLIVSYQEAKKGYIGIVNKDTQKKLMDASLTLWRLLGGFVLMHKKVRLNPDVKESQFYDGDHGLDALVFNDDMDPIHTSYDKVRNYLTKKPYSNDEKIKVNFENPTLLDGWDQNKERDNFGIILRKNDSYYLCLMKKGANNFFDESKNEKLYKGLGYEKMVYKLLPGPNKMLPKVIFSAKNLKFFNPSQEILRIREQESFKQGDKFSLKDLHTRIDFLKDALSKYQGRKGYDFQFRLTQQYEKINEFYHDIESQGYILTRKNIDENIVQSAVDNGDIYLFQIYNKDFNPHATGSKNIHTTYFQSLFIGGTKNLFKLNGEAEVFWRKTSIEKKVRDHSPKHKIDIIEKKRYTENKLMVHIPITLNFCHNEFRVNDITKKVIKENARDITILGIDRGEKHLLYYSLIKPDGTIIKTGSRNVIKNGLKTVPYKEMLDDREHNRDKAQLNRDQQEQIKDLKRGYISQVIHEICTMVIDHNAIIVLEDLNGGFKRSRQKVEKNVYQQFELALAKKLNYLVFKKRNEREPGGSMKGYQLTPEIGTFGDLSFQTGIMFYTPAGYTSTTCPCCGRRKHLYLKYNNEKTAKQDLAKLKIRREHDYFTVEYTIPEDIKKGKSNIQLLKTQRKLTTKNQIRSQYSTTSKQDVSYDITSEFNKLFGESDFDYKIWLGSASVSQCKTLIRLLTLLMKIRNAKTGTDIDVIQCPACNFHSNEGFQEHEYNGDANGAYNIARKGGIIIQKIVTEEKGTSVSQIECDNAWTKII